MRDDDTKSHQYDIKLRKNNQKKQYKMLLQQENDLRYPKNQEALKLQQTFENDYFSSLAQKVAAQEITDILEERKMKLNKSMAIKANWDM